MVKFFDDDSVSAGNDWFWQQNKGDWFRHSPDLARLGKIE